MKKVILLFISIFTLVSFSQASHLMGGEITYTHISGNNYEVTLIIYNDCSGSTTSGTSQSITFQSTSCGFNNIANLPLITGSPTNVSQLCPTATSTCNGGFNPGVEQFIYRGIIQLPPCSDWIIHWNSNARNGAITNLINPQVNFYIQNTLNNVIGVNNNSPQFFTLPTPFLCANQLNIFNHGASDTDGDSLYYSFSTPLTGTTPPGLPMTFSAGYSILQPMITSSGMNLNQQTGEMCFTPSQAQIAVVSVLIQEYRNNILIGSMIREMQVIVSGTCNNQPPIAGGIAPTCGAIGGMNITTQGPNVTQVDANSLIMCPGDSICFDIAFNDLDGDNVTITSNVASAIPTASFSITGNGTLNAIATFCWVPTPLDSGLNIIAIQVQDDACPISANSTFTYDITVFDQPFAGNDEFICSTSAIDSVQLIAVGGTNYTWSILSGDTNSTHLSCLNCDNPFVFPDSTTTYIVTSTGNFLCKTQDTVTIFVGIVPRPDLTDTSYCAGSSVSLNAGVGFGGVPYDSLVWGGVANNLTGQIINASVAGNYYVTAWHGGCSIESDTILVTENQLPIPIISTLSGNFHYCRVDSLVLNVQTGFNSYLWTPSGDTTNSILAGTGNYIISVTDNNNCVGTTSQLITNSNPQVSILGIDSICPDSILFLTSNPNNFSSYLWSNGDILPTTNTSVGAIGLIVTDNFGCTDTINDMIYSRPTPIASFTISPDFFGSPNIPIIFTDNSTGNPIFWDWNFGNGIISNLQNPTTIYQEAGPYTITLTVTNIYGCVSSTPIEYLVGNIIAPNVFTPNGDNFNDFLVFTNIDLLENHLEIFNRWGNQVFEKNNYTNDWDGDDLKNGTYFYILNVTLPGGDEQQFKGSITLLR